MQMTPENGCNQLVNNCANLQPNESAIIISNDTTADVGNLLTAAASKVSTYVTHHIIPSASMHGKEPPDEIAQLMKQSDVIFGLTKMSMAHTQARFHATNQGARYLSLPDYTLDLLTRPALFVDFRKLTNIADDIAALFTRAEKIKVTTQLGTHLTLDVTGRTGNSAPGWCYAKGILASPPDAEANVPPLENGTEGVMVVDGSVPCREFGILNEPLTLFIEKGKIVAVEGREADRMNAVLNKLGTGATRVAAEFGIGLNPAAELIGSMLEDEGCLGTFHIGFGSNITIGGLNRVPFHLDMIARKANIWLDDKMVMREGSLEVFQHLISEALV